MMKNYFLFIIILIAKVATAQNSQSGVYLTYNDYKNNKLSYEADCKTEKHSISFNEFFNKSYITVKHKGEKIKLQKDSIYGIANCNDSLIRFQDKEHFYLAEKRAVWIFYKKVNASEGKKIEIQRQYYFTDKGNGKLIPLTTANIKSAYVDNHELCTLIDAEIKNKQDISSYDEQHKMYKINYLINSIK